MSLHLAIAAVSAGILGYEVLLMRLFAIVQWHHFAYMVISVALLGFGASGTVLALAQDRLKPRFVLVFAVAAALFGITAVAGSTIPASRWAGGISMPAPNSRRTSQADRVCT